jgi:hypothetical protein
MPYSENSIELPSQVVGYSTDGRLIHVELSSKVSLAFSVERDSFSYQRNLNTRKLAFGMEFSSGCVGSPFANLIHHVVARSPQKEVIRIATRRIIAVVKYKHSCRDWTSEKHPGDTMRGHPTPVNAHRSVPAVLNSLDRPAFRFGSNRNLGQEGRKGNRFNRSHWHNHANETSMCQ